MEVRGVAPTSGYWQRDDLTGEPFTKGAVAHKRSPRQAGSGRVGLPAGALAGVDRRQVAAIRTLQVDEHALVAQ
jgi:hypothetical protein